MFNFFKKKEIFETPVNLPFTTDIHSHILPGIDDGSPDMATSLLLIQELYNLGIRKAIATPHIIGDLYRNNAATINSALQQVKLACAAASINIEISAAAEYMLDDYFMDLLDKQIPLLTLHNNLILTEFSYVSAPPGAAQMYYHITLNGYTPLLAHPERYHYFQNDYDHYFRLADIGYKLQVNLLSLVGYYGKAAARAGKFIVENNLADWVGTDMHHTRHADALTNTKSRILLHKLLQNKLYNNFKSMGV